MDLSFLESVWPLAVSLECFWVVLAIMRCSEIVVAFEGMATTGVAHTVPSLALSLFLGVIAPDGVDCYLAPASE